MALLICKNVGEGLRDAEATVTLEEIGGRQHFLPIDRGMIYNDPAIGDFITVSLIHVDEIKQAALVGLPVEADSGASRFWVPLDSLRPTEASEIGSKR